MRKKINLIWVLLALSFIQPVLGQVTTFGVPDCGSWVRNRREPDKSWLLGYLTGVNSMMYSSNKQDFLRHIDSAEQIFLWMDNHCRANPLDRMDSAAAKLALELVLKK